jgi:hypothetical protein
VHSAESVDGRMSDSWAATARSRRRKPTIQLSKSRIVRDPGCGPNRLQVLLRRSSRSTQDAPGRARDVDVDDQLAVRVRIGRIEHSVVAAVQKVGQRLRLVRFGLFRFFVDRFMRGVVRVRFDALDTRSGSRDLPVSRFHSS